MTTSALAGRPDGAPGPDGAVSTPRLISQAATGRLNRARLLQLLYDTGPLSRAELARIAEVAKTTIGSIVQPMIDEGILLEGDPRPSSAQGGKPARPIWFSPDGRPIVAVHVGPDGVRSALVSPTGAILTEVSAQYPGTDAGQRALVESIASCIERVLRTGDRMPLGVGVAVAGTVDTSGGRILEVNLAPALSGLALGPFLAERLGLRVYVDNHPRVQALGDRWFGLGRRVASFASVYCGEAIGAGFVIDGQVHRGASGAGGEVGHTVVDLGGTVCRCGRRGCWETVATHRWLRGRAATLGLPDADQLTVGGLAAAVNAGLAGALDLRNEFARNVAVGLVNLQQTIAPGLFVLHGDVVHGGEALRDLVEAHLVAGVAHHPGNRPRVVLGNRRNDMTLLGTAGLVLSQSLDLLT